MITILLDKAKKELEPFYCEQPIYYILAYILKMATEKPKLAAKNFAGVLIWFSNFFWKMKTKDKWLAETGWFLDQLNKCEGDGYEILSDPLNFKEGR